eukprot:3870851-Rhodomonas_salina.3
MEGNQGTKMRAAAGRSSERTLHGHTRGLLLPRTPPVAKSAYSKTQPHQCCKRNSPRKSHGLWCGEAICPSSLPLVAAHRIWALG